MRVTLGPCGDEARRADGRERGGRLDLQYACTFPLDTSRDCSADPFADCDCGRSETASSPICDSAHPSTQIAAKAYPTIRPFEVARLVGEAGVVASICPPRRAKLPPSSPYFGDRPAMASLGNRMAPSLLPPP